ncbi:LLM class flavin-dependent oxidoreductase, partial [candidate division KSB1 bacterium]|nr:LLM class flavin-dependent oxidoreductase [candidate division KSB1 bacterium]
RNPLVMAQTIASLDELTGGRMILSPGACTNTHARRYGIEPISPPQVLREWVEAMRLVISGKNASYHGQVVSFDDAQLGFEPVRDHIPFLIPATSTTGLRLAGKIGDGVMLNAVCSPEYSTNALAIVRDSLEEEGRSWDDFIVAQIVNCSIVQSTGDEKFKYDFLKDSSSRLPPSTDFSPNESIEHFPFCFKAFIPSLHFSTGKLSRIKS